VKRTDQPDLLDLLGLRPPPPKKPRAEQIAEFICEVIALIVLCAVIAWPLENGLHTLGVHTATYGGTLSLTLATYLFARSIALTKRPRR
jgi:hypothetical protein